MKTIFETWFILLMGLILSLIGMGVLLKWKQFETLSIGIPVAILIIIAILSNYNGVPVLKWATITFLRFSVFMTAYFLMIKILERAPIEIGWEGYSNGFFMLLSWVLTIILLVIEKYKK